MKRFLLFAGDHYYASGGWNDFKGDFDDVSEAKKWIEMNKGYLFDWAHAIDTLTKEYITIITK